jgi:YggT family protein
MENPVYFLIKFVEVLANVLNIAILARVIMSWLSMGKPMQLGKITSLIYDITEPIFSLFRKIPLRIGMIDITPLVAIITINFLSGLVISILAQFL